jgi:hypothetical protein
MNQRKMHCSRELDKLLFRCVTDSIQVLVRFNYQNIRLYKQHDCKSYAMQRRVVWRKFSDISEERIASTFMTKNNPSNK